jgi:hypothetical protein
MSSPIVGVFQEVAAVTGVAGQGLLSFGGTALAIVTQCATLAANIKNAGGYAEIFCGVMDVMQAPLKPIITGLSGAGSGLVSIGGSIAGTLPKIGQWITSMWTEKRRIELARRYEHFLQIFWGLEQVLPRQFPK